VSDETPAASCAAKAAIRSFSSRRSRSITTRRGVCSQQLLSDRGDLRGRESWSVGHAVWTRRTDDKLHVRQVWCSMLALIDRGGDNSHPANWTSLPS